MSHRRKSPGWDADDQASDSSGSTNTLVEFPTPDAGSTYGDDSSFTMSESLPEARDPSAFRKAATWLNENPITAVYAAIGATGLAVVAAPTLVSAPVIGAAGVGVHSVAAGGVAASSAGGVAIGVLQGVMSGAAGVVAAGFFGGGIVWKRWIGEKKEKKQEGEEEHTTNEGAANETVAEGSARGAGAGDNENTRDQEKNTSARAGA